MDFKSLISIISNDSSSATRNTIFNTPVCASVRFNILDNNTGPISDNVTRTGNPFSPNKSQNSTGYDLSLKESKPSTLLATLSFISPTFARPEISPFISAKNTGTPMSLNDSASVLRVIVLPVPVAPAINPCLFAIFGSK